MNGTTKPNFIMGHSAQAVPVLAKAANTIFAVPLGMKIHAGVIFSKRDKRTLLDKLLIMISQLGLDESFYRVEDAYYDSGKLIKAQLKENSHLITQAKSTAVAYHQPPARTSRPTRGRPRLYGKKVKLDNPFRSTCKITTMPSPAYDEKNIMLRVRTIDLLWQSAGSLVGFVLVEHPSCGRLVLMCSDCALESGEIIRLCSLRFNIELGWAGTPVQAGNPYRGNL